MYSPLPSVGPVRCGPARFCDDRESGVCIGQEGEVGRGEVEVLFKAATYPYSILFCLSCQLVRHVIVFVT